MTVPDNIEDLKALVILQQGRIASQAQRIEELERVVAELNARLNSNSSNSSKPPSSDGYKKKPAFPKRANKKKGGQKGHLGGTLKQVAEPDKIIEHKVLECNCGCCLENTKTVLAETRQVFDLPEPKLEVTEHQLYETVCPSCGRANRATGPESVNAPVQYGNGVKALVVLLTVSYKLPVKKVQLLFSDLFGRPINEATVIGINKQGYRILAPTEEAIKEKVLGSSVAHADETGMRVEGSLHWLHTMSTLRCTYLFVHKKRGMEAMDSQWSLLPSFRNWLIHDCLGSYFRFDRAKHGVCGAHLLREFQGLIDNGSSKWTHTFKAFLIGLLDMPLEKRLLLRQHIEQRYQRICRIADAMEPLPKKTGKKGRPKRTKGRNLLVRLVDHKDAVLAFAFNEEVPFTNNLAERDIRPAKIKQKISGCFRTFEGAQIYARIEGFVSTARKNNRSIFKELKNSFEGYNFIISFKLTT